MDQLNVVAYIKVMHRLLHEGPTRGGKTRGKVDILWIYVDRERFNAFRHIEQDGGLVSCSDFLQLFSL